MHEILHAAIQLAPLVQALTFGEASVAVSDRESFIYYQSGKTLDFRIKPPQPIPPTGSMVAAMKQAGVLRTVMPADNFGFRYLAVGMALRDSEGEVVGAIMTAFPLTLEDQLGKMATDLAAAMQQFAATFEHITEIAGNSGATATAVEQTAQSVSGTLANTGTMTTGITRIADKTRLLGLNASIEAAHAGKAGSGFAVVAREIQALSDQSIRAAQQVNDMLAGLTGQTVGLGESVEQLRSDSERLRTALGEAQSYVERLAGMAETLQTMANRTTEE